MEALCHTALAPQVCRFLGSIHQRVKRDGGGGANRELAACGGTPGGCQLGGVDG